MRVDLTIAVVIATTGRSDAAKKTVENLGKQTRRPDRVLVIGAEQGDLAGVVGGDLNLTAEIARKGSCAQRNRALELIGDGADIITFMDDDFVPDARYLEETIALFAGSDRIVGVTGNLRADGIDGPGITFEDADSLLKVPSPVDTALRKRQALYGCNMSLRASAIRGRRFDENLPLYGWLEDIDFTHPLTKVGDLVSSNRVTGVHLGLKKGRSPGRRVGYSQVANVIYLKRKKTMQPKLSRRLLRQQILANILRSFRPEPWVDRRGRLVGNMMALSDLLLGRINPRRIESITSSLLLANVLMALR